MQTLIDVFSDNDRHRKVHYRFDSLKNFAAEGPRGKVIVQCGFDVVEIGTHICIDIQGLLSVRENRGSVYPFLDFVHQFLPDLTAIDAAIDAAIGISSLCIGIDLVLAAFDLAGRCAFE